MKPNAEAESNALPGVADALHRAAHRARIVAACTGTPLVLSIDGQIEKRWIENGDLSDLRKDFEHYLNAVPDAEPTETDRLT